MIGTAIFCVAIFCVILGVFISHYPDRETDD
jgi:hypothetical protein